MFDIAFPVSENEPAVGFERGGVPVVSRDVRTNFRYPVGRVMAGGEFGETRIKVATVPEVAIAEDQYAPRAKNEIWLAREILGTDSVT
jgi:hypothetical protein|nr:hypothetical protein [Kofleriaceae bacterium]